MYSICDIRFCFKDIRKFRRIMKRIIFALVLATLLIGCDKVALRTQRTNNNEFNVQLLFQVDCVKVYRFSDGVNNHYFTSQGETISTKKIGNKIEIEENIK